MSCLLEELRTLDTQGLCGRSCLFFQLYVNSDPEVTKTILRQVRDLGFKGLFITVDTPVSGKRNADSRFRAREDAENDLMVNSTAPPLGASEKVRLQAAASLSRSLNWADLLWIRKEWDGPIVLKGIQCVEDARKAAKMGVEGIYLSNHGGRQLDCAPSSLTTLMEIRTFCPEILDCCEIYMDGGLKRGGNIIKAICLGARAVGIGRPFLYAIAAYGVQGFVKAVSSKSFPGHPVF